MTQAVVIIFCFCIMLLCVAAIHPPAGKVLGIIAIVGALLAFLLVVVAPVL